MLAGPLQCAHQRAGATFRTWERRLWAEHFGDPIGERLAVRSAVGIWDISPLRKWEVRGRLAVDVIDRLFTNTVRGMPVGAIRYGVFCDEGARSSTTRRSTCSPIDYGSSRLGTPTASTSAMPPAWQASASSP